MSSPNSYRPKRPSMLRQRISSGSSTTIATLKSTRRTALRWQRPTLSVEQEYELAKRRLKRELRGDERLVRMLGHANLMDNLVTKIQASDEEEMIAQMATAQPLTPYAPPRSSRARKQEQQPALDEIAEEEEGEAEQWEDVSDASDDDDDDFSSDDELYTEEDYFGTALYRAETNHGGDRTVQDVPDLVDDSGSAQSSALPSPEDQTRMMSDVVSVPDMSGTKDLQLESIQVEVAQES